MALRNIVTVGDPVLTKVCRPVTKFDDRLSQLIDDMIETLHDANGAGLAAPQIGVLRRVVIVNTEGEDWELVNPEIVEVSEEEQTGIEGCLSLPGKWGLVTRPEYAKVRAQDRHGDWYEYEGEDLTARCFCMRSTIWTDTCTPRLPKRCSRPRSLRSFSRSRRTRRKTRTRKYENCLYGYARDREGVPRKALHGRL